MELLSISQLANEWEISSRRIQVLCTEGRIRGAKKVGYSWVIPANAEKPSDKRIKTGQYIKAQNNSKKKENKHEEI